MVKYYYDGSTRVAMRTGSSLNWLFGDHLGSTSRSTDANGNSPTAQFYKPWGETRYSSGALPTTYLYTGQRRESSLGGSDGLYYYGARFYDPWLGRFIQMDSLLPVIGKSQTCDKCAYADNNPVNHVDPTGNSVDDCGLPGIACSINIKKGNNNDKGDSDQSNLATPRLSKIKKNSHNEPTGNTDCDLKKAVVGAALGVFGLIIGSLGVGVALVGIAEVTATSVTIVGIIHGGAAIAIGGMMGLSGGVIIVIGGNLIYKSNCLPIKSK